MTFITLFKYLTPVIIVALWAPYIQTIGHVWLFVSILISGAMGLKIVVPHAWLFLIIIFVWWGLFATYNTHAIISYANMIVVTLFGRNSN